MAAGLVALGAALQLVRGPGVPVWRSVFGEDGAIFFTEALASRGWGSVFSPYQGYLQVAPRLVGELVAMLPLSVAAVSLAVLSALFTALLSLFIYAAGTSVLVGRWARAAVAVAPLLLPAAYETTSNATDLHWYLDYACFWALLVGCRSRRLVVPAAAIAGLAVLSDPLAGLFLPLAAWQAATAFGFSFGGAQRFVLRSSAAVRRIGLVVPAVYALGLLLQVVFGMAQQHAGQFGTSHPADLPAAYGLRVAGSFLFGDRFLAGAFVTFGRPFALGCLVVVAVGIAVALRNRSSRTLVLLAAGYSLLWLCVPLVLRGTDGMLPAHLGYLSGTRYTVVPVLLLVVACAAWLDRLEMAPRAVASVGFLVIAALSFALPSQRTYGPVWSETLSAAADRCAATHGMPHQSGRSAEAPWGLPAGPADALIPVAPRLHPQWFVVVSCRRLS